MATDVDVTPLLRQPISERSEFFEADSPPLSPDLCTQPVARALAGVIVYVEVRSIDSRENRSSAIASELETLGATVCTRFTKDVTHVVFKDGKSSVRVRAERNRIYLVSPLWVEACKRANDWISEAKYPVITCDSNGGALRRGTPVVLGKIKRIKSMQPKPLDEEIARSLGRGCKRPQAVSTEESGKKGRREEGGNDGGQNSLNFVDMDSDEDSCSSASSLDLPAINLPHTPRHPLTEKAPNSITPFITDNNAKQTDKQIEHQIREVGANSENKRCEDAEDNESDFQKGVGSEVVAKGNKSKQTKSNVKTVVTKGSKVATGKASTVQPVGSKVAIKAIKYSLVARQHSKAVARSKKTILKTAIAAKKAKKVGKTSSEDSTVDTETETEPRTEKEEKTVSPNWSGRKRRRANTRIFARELPSLVLTSVDAQDQDVVMSVVKKLGRFSISSTVDEVTSHVVCGRSRRTINILVATIKGCWTLSLDWVWKSLEAGRWLPEEPFEMADDFPAAQFFRLERAEAGLLFRPSFFKKAGSVFVSPSSSPPCSQLEMLLSSGGASVTRSLRKADVCVGCLSPREGEEEGVWCVSEHWILDSITEHQMLPYDSFLLNRPESRATSPEL